MLNFSSCRWVLRASQEPLGCCGAAHHQRTAGGSRGPRDFTVHVERQAGVRRQRDLEPGFPARQASRRLARLSGALTASLGPASQAWPTALGSPAWSRPILPRPRRRASSRCSPRPIGLSLGRRRETETTLRSKEMPGINKDNDSSPSNMLDGVPAHPLRPGLAEATLRRINKDKARRKSAREPRQNKDNDDSDYVGNKLYIRHSSLDFSLVGSAVKDNQYLLKIYEAYISSRTKTKIALYIMSSIFLAASCLLVVFAPDGREITTNIIAISLFALALGIAGFSFFRLKIPLIAVEAGNEAPRNRSHPKSPSEKELSGPSISSGGSPPTPQTGAEDPGWASSRNRRQRVGVAPIAEA